jgi:hypothetical protein
LWSGGGAATMVAIGSCPAIIAAINRTISGVAGCDCGEGRSSERPGFGPRKLGGEAILNRPLFVRRRIMAAQVGNAADIPKEFHGPVFVAPWIKATKSVRRAGSN